MPKPIGGKNKKKVAGELRRSQILTTYGCGALVDFPRLSGIMAGIDEWKVQLLPETAKIRERNLEIMLGKDYFYQVSSPSDKDFEVSFTLPSYRFPTWYYCPECHRLDHYKKISKPPNSRNDYNSALYCNVCSDKTKKVKLIPSRFIVACLNGHVDDFPYVLWTHRNRREGICENPRLQLKYEGSTGGLDSIHLYCETCKAETTMAGCMSQDALKDKRCTRKMPWLGFDEKEDGRWEWHRDEEECLAQPRVLQRSANNVYYAVNKSALTIPPWSERLQTIFAKKDSMFQFIFNQDEELTTQLLHKEYENNKELYGEDEEQFVKAAKFRYTTAENSISVDEKTLRMDEYRAFCGSDADDELFRTEGVSVPDFLKSYIAEIKLVKKLREVMVLQGFRRILPTAVSDSKATEISDSAELNKGEVSNAEFSPISREPKNWLPAIELFGEGIFIKLDEDRVSEWEKKHNGRYSAMFARHEKTKWIGHDMFYNGSPRYVLLHTISHLLIRQLSSQCGYAAASIKEKIYSTFKDEDLKMCGILIYTSATDTDGSLGGLVREGYPDRIQTTFENMLQESTWCSNDPLCIESMGQGFGNLNYASCHACSLLPETSCESMNCLIDRASVVGTPDNKDLAYFKGIL